MWPFSDDDDGKKSDAPYSGTPRGAAAPDKPKRTYAPIDAGKYMGGMAGEAVKQIRGRRKMLDDAIDGASQ